MDLEKNPQAKVDLRVPASVASGVPFIVTVEVFRAQPGESVTMLVEQRRGARPFWPAQAITDFASERGVASASFRFVLAGPGHAVLLASAYDRAGTCFNPDGDTIVVL